MLIVFRTDASSSLGLGHLRRCISLALALRDIGAEISFVLRHSDVDSLALLAADGFEGALLHGTADEVQLEAEMDARAFIDQCSGRTPSWVLVDHYALDARWHNLVRQSLGCRIASIDDLADRPLSVEVLIDHNVAAALGHRIKYAAVLQAPAPRWLCGPRFALVGPAYRASPDFEITAEVRSIGIFLGGTDPASLTLPALAACRQVAKFKGSIEIVSTSSNPRLAQLQAAVQADGNAWLSIDLPDLADFYRRHDLQVGAGGGSTWERCAVGAPALVLCAATNQQAVIPALLSMGALATSEDNSPAAIGRALKALLDSPLLRTALSQRSRGLVDGQGAARVALALCSDMLELRPAEMSDAETMWNWRNHPRTRAVSRHSSEISLLAHKDWLQKALTRPATLLLIGHCGTRDIGVIRFDQNVDSSAHEVSLYLDPGLHGLGLGNVLLRQGEAVLQARVGPTTILAEVLPDNAASHQLFMGAGYRADSSHTYSKRQAQTSSTAANVEACAGSTTSS